MEIREEKWSMLLCFSYCLYQYFTRIGFIVYIYIKLVGLYGSSSTSVTTCLFCHYEKDFLVRAYVNTYGVREIKDYILLALLRTRAIYQR